MKKKNETITTPYDETSGDLTEVRMVRVLHSYGGSLTGEVRIVPGVYAVDAQELFGIAEYLVENGHAEWLGETAPVVEVSDNESTDEVEAVRLRDQARADNDAQIAANAQQ